MSEDTAGDGTVLGEEARQAVASALCSPDPERFGVVAWVSPDRFDALLRMSQLAIDAVSSHVAALVAQARAAGAAEEREQIARDLHEGGYGQAAVRLAQRGWPSSPRDPS